MKNKNKKLFLGDRIKVGIVASVLVIATFSVLVVSAEKNESSLVTVNYIFGVPEIEKVEIGEIVYDRIIMQEASGSGEVGEPYLPSRGANILLPQGTQVLDIAATGTKISLGEGFLVEPAGQPVPLMEKAPSPSVNKEIYSSENLFPGRVYTKVDTYSFRGYQILVLKLHPVQYIPATGELFYYKDITISVETEPSDEINPLFRGLETDKIEIARKIDNPLYINTYKKNPDQPSRTLSNYDLLILTTDSLQSAFQPLKDYHDNHGLSTVIKTLADVGGSGNPEDIRDYITGMYTASNIEYVIIGGDDDVIPAKDLYVQAYPGGDIEYNMPSDVYYACLDGTYNYDGDGRWGEPTDGEGGGDVDLVAEVYVGRASVGSTSEVDNFVDKTIDYLQTADEYLKDVLWVGEYLGFGGIAEWGGNYKDEMIGGSSNHGYTTVGIPTGPDDFTVSYLYERDMSWGKTHIMNYMNSGIHFLNHLGHGSSNYAMHMYNPDCLALTNDKYFFVYSQTCLAGHFDGTDCWAEQINIKTEHGAFAVIMNARYGWGVYSSTDGPSQRFDREFWDAVFNINEGMPEIGKANHDSKEDNLYRIGDSCMRWCYYELNLFGDPTVAIKGAEVLKADFTYSPEYPNPGVSIQFTDQSTGDITYRSWNFGDGDSSGATNPTHVYQSAGTYTATLTVYNNDGQSDSISKEVEVKDNWEPVAVAYPEEYAGSNPTVQFDGSDSWDPDGTIVSYHWDFDDGDTSDEMNPIHTFSQDGEYDVTLTVTDNGGAQGVDHCHIYIDATTPPVTTVDYIGSIGQNGWFKSYQVKVILTATDWSGVDKMYYSLDGGDEKEIDCNDQLDFTHSFNVYKNGKHTVEFYSKDIYGNIEDMHTGSFNLDAETPITTCSLSGITQDEWYIDQIEITLETEDSYSGVNEVHYRMDSNGNSHGWIVLNGNGQNVFSYTFTETNDGQYTLKYYSIDVAGNPECSMPPKSILFDLEANPPVTTCELEGENLKGWFSSPVNITLSAVDLGWGVNSTYYKMDDKNWVIYSGSFTVSEQGEHTISYYSIDNYGRIEETKSDTFLINYGEAPYKPSKPSGPAQGGPGEEYTYRSSTVDPEGNQIWYMWDWGDGNVSDWLGPYNSGETCEASHIWSSKGSYEVKVKAKDEYGSESPWSDPLPISMPKNRWSFRVLFLQFLEKMIERFPLLQQILTNVLT